MSCSLCPVRAWGTYRDVNCEHLAILDNDSPIDDVEVHLAWSGEHQRLNKVMMRSCDNRDQPSDLALPTAWNGHVCLLRLMNSLVIEFWRAFAAPVRAPPGALREGGGGGKMHSHSPITR